MQYESISNIDSNSETNTLPNLYIITIQNLGRFGMCPKYYIVAANSREEAREKALKEYDIYATSDLNQIYNGGYEDSQDRVVENPQDQQDHVDMVDEKDKFYISVFAWGD